MTDSLYKRYLLDLLQYFRKFIELSDEDFSVISQYFEVRHFDKKVKVVKLGEVDQYFNIIMKGLVRKYMISKKKEITIQLATEGHIIHSELSFNLRVPSDCILETLEPTTFLSISHDNIELIYHQYPRMERLGRLIITDMFIKKDFREMALLNKTTRERFLDYLQNHPDMLQRVPQKYLASYLNIKPETFSRLKHLLRLRKKA
jgi:CRP-like cAMP-binding protein